MSLSCAKLYIRCCAGLLQVAFKVKEDLGAQLLHYDVSVGAYMPLDDPRALAREALALLIPCSVAEEVGRSLIKPLRCGLAC